MAVADSLLSPTSVCPGPAKREERPERALAMLHGLGLPRTESARAEGPESSPRFQLAEFFRVIYQLLVASPSLKRYSAYDECIPFRGARLG